MDIVHPMRYTIDLKDGLVQKPMETRLMKGDKKANCVIVTIKKDGDEVTLSGVTASGSFIRPGDDATIPLRGSISGNEVTVELADECYEASGACQIDVELAAGERKRTILSITGDVVKKGSGAYVDVSGVIPSVDDIIAQYAEMKAVTDRTLAAGTNANEATKNANAAADNANNAAAKIDGMTASAANGTDAGVTVSEKDGVKHFAFTLPKGDKGDRGEKGETGSVENMPFYEGIPAAPGTASTGSSDRVSRGDHVHPFPNRIKNVSSNAYAELRQLASDRTKSVSMIDPDTGEEVDLYAARDTGKPTVRYKDANGKTAFHALYSDLNKPKAGDVGAISKEGGTATGLIKATNFVVGNATDYPSVGFQGLDVSKGQLGAIQFSALSDGRRFSFVQYPSDQDGKESRYLESYRLPKPSSGLTGTQYYDVYTTKNPPTASEVGAATANHTHQELKKTGGNSQEMWLGFTDTEEFIGLYVSGSYSADDRTAMRMGIHVNKDTGVLHTRLDSKVGTKYTTIYTSANKPTPADIGGFVGCHEVSVTSESIAAGQTGTASVTFTAISGATKYYAVLCTNGTVWGYVAGVTISGTTLTVTFYNSSAGAHTIGAKLLIIGVK